jgi:large subunit ribosomal protein L15
MVVRKKKKSGKFRGSRTHGYGSHKKHRGAGSRGGRGKAGMHKHKWSSTIKYEPDRFGKRGFKRPSATTKKVNAINVGQLEKVAASKKTLNLAEFGYDKVLGSGTISTALDVTAASFSRGAVKKIEEAGGKVTVIEKPQGQKEKSKAEGKTEAETKAKDELAGEGAPEKTKED